MPLLFTLGDLHSIVQVLFGWAGDHLHQFSVGTTVLYEYDLATSWIHEITREKVLEIDQAEPYPTCVAFRGEQPVEEYADEYDGDGDPVEGPLAEREPFSLAVINAALGEAVAPLPRTIPSSARPELALEGAQVIEGQNWRYLPWMTRNDENSRRRRGAKRDEASQSGGCCGLADPDDPRSRSFT